MSFPIRHNAFPWIRRIILLLFSVSAIPYLWISYVSLMKGSATSLIWISAFVLAALGVVFLLMNKLLLNRPYRYYATLFLSTGGLILVLLFWNSFFSFYVDVNPDFKRDIFRGAFTNLRAPAYTYVHLKWPLLYRYLLLFLVPFSYALYYLFNAPKLDYHWTNYSAIYLFVAILVYGLTDGLETRLLQENAHMKVFRNSATYFGGISDVLRNYVSRMDKIPLSAHYPPGNTLLYMFEHYHFPYFTKLVVFLATVVTVYPMRWLMKSIRMQEPAINLALALYVLSTSVPVFATFTLNPLTVPLTVYMVYLLYRYLERKEWLSLLLLGFAASLSFLFTYATSITGVLLCSILVFHSYYGKLSWLAFFKVGITVVMVLLFTYLLLFTTTGFDQWACFLRSVHNNTSSMSNGFDNLVRYLLRSSGNLLAYLASVGLVIVGFALTSYHKTKCSIQNRTQFILSASTLITVFVASFSGLFFLETARIWLFFTPFFCILAAVSLQEYLFHKQLDLIAVAVLTTLLISILEEIYIDHAFGYFARGW